MDFHCLLHRSPVLILAALTLMLGGCVEDDPNIYNRLSRGAFSGANAQLLGNLIGNTTGVVSDTVSSMLITGELIDAHPPGDTSSQRSREAMALFESGGLTSRVSEVRFGSDTVGWVEQPTPAHYARIFPGVPDREVGWQVQWPSGTAATLRDSLPPGFGTISVSTGPDASLAALDAGQLVRLDWSGVWPGRRVYLRVQWQRMSDTAQNPGQLVSTIIPVLVVADSGFVPLPGADIARIIPAATGRLTFTLHRGSYGSEVWDGRGYGLFSFIRETVYVNVRP